LTDRPPQVWRPLTPECLAWREWDDDLVIYNDATGSTHHLDPLGAEVLLALLRSPQGIDAIAVAHDVTARVDADAGVDLSRAIERALAELTDFRLAARAD
jgi:PqqD family protein of HPr-rel-A system